MKRWTVAYSVVSLLSFFVSISCSVRVPAEPSSSDGGRLQWWRDARFGLFIHWGPVSLKGTEISWSRGGERRGTGGTGQIPVEVYDNLYKQFNPTLFNAEEWVRIAKDAGARYLVFTSKHHDGFANFDSNLTDYKITSPESPFRRDIVKELADACHKEGLRFGLYYSQPDWHHPDYRTENHARYIEYLHGQVRELLSQYGQIDIIWFDGLGGKPEDWKAEELFKLIRGLQPGILINNRAGLPGDFDTPEQKVGQFKRDRAWESCITIGTQWSWKPNDKIKSLKECIHLLLDCVGGDGNLLLNVGPMPDGRIEPRQVNRLHEIGEWLRRYGVSVYGTRGGPYKPRDWGVSTCRDDKIYLHVMEPKYSEIKIPHPGKKILKAAILEGSEIEPQAEGNGEVVLRIPEDLPDRDLDTVIELTVEGKATEIPPI